MLERLDYTKSEINRVAWENLLSASGLRPDPPYTAVYGVFRDDQLVATGGRDGARIKCVAVRHDYRGGTVFHELLSGMIMEALDAGINRLFLYTTPDAVQAFEQLGFRVLARIDNGISFMERGTPTIDDYTRRLREQLDRYQEKRRYLRSRRVDRHERKPLHERTPRPHRRRTFKVWASPSLHTQ